MIRNEGMQDSGGGAVVRNPELACLLFAYDSDDAERQRLVLEQHGIFAQVGDSSAASVPAAGLGVPLVVSPDDQERANMILACIEATGGDPWDDSPKTDDDVDDFAEDEVDDDDDDFVPDDANEDDDDFDDDDEDLDDDA
jgi:hypothetical protein